MEPLASLYQVETYAAIATKPTKKSRKNSRPTQTTTVQDSNNVAFSWMP